MVKKTVIYPGTFDPITVGHVDIIERASNLFGEVIVTVAPTSRKAPYFSWSERIALAESVLASYKNVVVTKLEGLLVEFTRKKGASLILRGLRVMSDFDYEFQLAHMNDALSPDIETIFLPAKQMHTYISSSIVREIVDLGGDASMFVPQAVSDYLKKNRINPNSQ